MPYQIFETETFSRLYRAMEKVEQEWVDKIKNQLIENSQVGKPLKFDWFREKKFGDKRLYYLVYKDGIKIIMDGANPDDVHKAINKDLKRFESRNEYENLKSLPTVKVTNKFPFSSKNRISLTLPTLKPFIETVVPDCKPPTLG